MATPTGKTMYLCDFCGKAQHEVRLIAGPTVFICNECIELCNQILSGAVPGETEYLSWLPKSDTL